MADKNNIYIFISDESRKYYKATQSADGTYTITKNSQPYPIKWNPTNLLKSELEFGTNAEYFSMVRTINYPLEFVKDGAAILRERYLLGKSVSEKTYITIVEWDGNLGYHVLSYYGRIDFKQKHEDPKAGIFTVSCLDDSAWGILSLNDKTEYAIDCTSRNPKAIKVVIDGITLENTFLYQTVRVSYNHVTAFGGGEVTSYIVPLVLVNQSGDSVDFVSGNQEYFQPPDFYNLGYAGYFFFYSTKDVVNVRFRNTISFQWDCAGSNVLRRVDFYLDKGNGSQLFVGSVVNNPIKKVTYTVVFDILTNYVAFGKVKLFVRLDGDTSPSEPNPIVFTFITTNIELIARTTPDSQIVYGLRAIDLLQQLVEKATLGRFSINSNFLTTNNKDFITSGDAIRGIANAKIYTSFSDFFATFNAEYFMAMRNVLGQLWLEECTEIYKQTSTLLDIGDAIDLQTEPATEYYKNQIEAGSPDVDLRHPSGRLEFNSLNKWSSPLQEIKETYSAVTKYRQGCYDIQFLIVDYRGSSTVDNTGDKSVYMIKITDNRVTSTDDIEDFESIDFDSALLAPVIKSPQANDVITYNLPVIRGVGVPGTTVNIYVDAILDGSTVVDIAGRWNYNIVTPLSSYDPGIDSGVHLVQATNTDLSGPNTSVSITIDTTVTTADKILYPAKDDSLYNNLPLIKGVAQQGQNIDISLNGVVIGSVVTDASCKWQFQTVVPIPNGTNTISINAGSDSNTFDVDTDVEYPLITEVDGEVDGTVVVNPLPLIKGIAKPGTIVKVYLDYIPNKELGIVTANATGNWSLQVVNTSYNDPSSGLPVLIAPISNGNHIISTSLGIHSVAINVRGYRLSRPAYSSITGVIDNTVFNTEYSPARKMERHYPMLASIFNKIGPGKLLFEKPSKNGELRTVLGSVVVDEDADIPISSLGNPLLLLEYALIKTSALKSFAKILEDFNNGGIIKTRFRGTDIFLLPIGSMRIENIASNVQDWKLLMSPLTSYVSLLNLYKQGTYITLMKNAIYHSDYNTLHFVTYNYQKPAKYNNIPIYEDWFSNRNDAWLFNPYYVQKHQRSQVFIDQVITNGITGLFLRLYKCGSDEVLDTIFYNPVNPAPIPSPDIVMEASIDLSLKAEGIYYFVMCLNRATSLTVTVGSNPAYIYEFQLGGTPTVGEKVTVTYKINGGADIVFSTIVQEGWTIADIIAALYTQIDAYPGFDFTSTSGGNTIYVEQDPADTLTGAVTVELFAEIAISEKIDSRDSWPGTILIESSNSINYTGAFFSTGFRTILRVEGLIKKLQPDTNHNSAKEEDGDTLTLYSNTARKRIIRFGTAYGLPDYLYLKIANAINTDDWQAEGISYSLTPESKIEPSEDIPGHPLYYYNVEVAPTENIRGKVFSGGSSSVTDSVILVVDPVAMGLPGGSLINITLENE